MDEQFVRSKHHVDKGRGGGRMTRMAQALALIFCVVVAGWTASAFARGAAVHVSGYTRANGTYVAPHYRSAPDGDFSNNWSTLGNINPYTGKPGTLTSPHGYGGGAAISAPVVIDGTSSFQPQSEPVEPSQPSQSRPSHYSSPTVRHNEAPAKQGNWLPEHAQLDYSRRNWECVRGYRRTGDTCSQVTLPRHAKLDFFGHNWECERGFRKVADNCLAVEIPIHAKLDILGHEWECERGYQRQDRGCLAVGVPEHAKLDFFGHDWECVKGYRKSGDNCAIVSVPQNAKLDFLGHDWECMKGYLRSGNQCLQVQVPLNARLDFLRHDWVCNAGFQRSVDACSAVSRP